MNPTTTHRAASYARILAAFSDHIADELRCYQEHLSRVRGLSATSCQQRARIVGRLLQQKFAGGPVDVTKLLADDVRRFLANQLEARRTPSNASQLAGALRSYLRYRTTCSDQVGALTAVISNPVHWKLASLPRALKPEEAERLLNVLTTARRWPKRGYAIVRCALDLGLRCGEIAHLMISDIDWRAGTVTLRGTKSLRQDVLPLPMETGQALADYLQHERPASSHPAIFVRRQVGPDRPVTSMAISKLIQRAGRRVGLMHFSAHALRHYAEFRTMPTEMASSLANKYPALFQERMRVSVSA